MSKKRKKGIVCRVVRIGDGYEAIGCIILELAGIESCGIVKSHGFLFVVFDACQPDWYKDESGEDEGHQDGEDDERFFLDADGEFALYDEEELIHGRCCFGVRRLSRKSLAWWAFSHRNFSVRFALPRVG